LSNWVLGCANILGKNTNDKRHGYISEMYIIISSSLIVPLGIDFARVLISDQHVATATGHHCSTGVS